MKLILALCLFLFSILALPQRALAVENTPPPQSFYRGIVIKIIDEGVRDVFGQKTNFQNLGVKLSDGPDKGEIVNVENGGLVQMTQGQKVSVGEDVVVSKIQNKYVFVDKYRLGYLPFLLIAFGILVAFVAGKKGIGALLGLGISLFVIITFLIPSIISGSDPLLTTIVSAVIILLTTTYLAHGVSKQTTIALLATLLALMFTVLLSVIVVNGTHLLGIGNEESYALLLNQATSKISLQGILLSGIVIGTLGALNDITTTQSVAIFEFAKSDPKLKFEQLYEKGSNIGKEHIASLVNTLVLAYAGSSMALFIFFVLNPQQQPIWMLLNSEIIFEEIVRTVVGSAGLILAVPLVTCMASWYVSRR